MASDEEAKISSPNKQKKVNTKGHRMISHKQGVLKQSCWVFEINLSRKNSPDHKQLIN